MLFKSSIACSGVTSVAGAVGGTDWSGGADENIWTKDKDPEWKSYYPEY